MKQSDSITNLLRSIINAQGKMTTGVKRDGTNATLQTQYTTLGCVIDATKTVLLNEGIVVIQSPGEYVSGQLSLTTRLCHSSGEWLEGVCSSPLSQADPQGFGMAVSYLRRYALTAMLGLYQADDDGQTNASSTAEAKSAAKSGGSDQTDQAKTDAALAAKLEQWKKTIKTASPERLKQAKETAKSIFTGATLVEINTLIDQHLAADFDGFI